VIRGAWAVVPMALALVAAAVNATAVAASPSLTAGAGGGVEQLSYGYLDEFSTICQPITWGTANIDVGAAAALSVQGSVYAGMASDTLSGSGCDTLESGAGTATLSMSGSNPLGAQFSCSFPSGYYGRVAGVMQMTFTGSCTIDNLVSSGVTLNSTGAWVPVRGVNRPGIVYAELAQGWQIIP